MKTITTPIKQPSTAKNITLWVLQILTAAAFLMAGFGKLSGNPMMIDLFTKIGVGQWLRYVTGSIELVSAILLLIPAVTPVGALLLVATMTGALCTHFFVIGGNPTAAAVLLLLASLIAWGRKDHLPRLF